MKKLLLILILASVLPGIVQAQFDGFEPSGGTGTTFDSTWVDARIAVLENYSHWLSTGTNYSFYPVDGDTTLFKISRPNTTAASMLVKGPNYTTTIAGNSSTFSTYAEIGAAGSNGYVRLNSNVNAAGAYLHPSYLLFGTSSPAVASYIRIQSVGSWFSLNTPVASRTDNGLSALAATGIRADTVISTKYLGGLNPIATGYLASVFSGIGNAALGDSSAVLSGGFGRALGKSSVVVGGTGGTAYGEYDFIGGGFKPTGGTGGYNVVVGGASCSAGYRWTFMGGGNGNAISAGSEAGTIVGGAQNSVTTVGADGGSDDYTFVGGGQGNIGSGAYSGIFSGYLGKTNAYGMQAHAAGSFTAAAGTAQCMELIARDTTSLATEPDTLALDGIDGIPAKKQAVIDTGTVWGFEVTVVARTLGGSGARYRFTGTIKNIAGTVSFIGTPTADTPDEDDANWACSVAANDTADALSIIVNGADGQIIRWVATIRLTQCKW